MNKEQSIGVYILCTIIVIGLIAGIAQGRLRADPEEAFYAGVYDGCRIGAFTESGISGIMVDDYCRSVALGYARQLKLYDFYKQGRTWKP